MTAQRTESRKPGTQISADLPTTVALQVLVLGPVSSHTDTRVGIQQYDGVAFSLDVAKDVASSADFDSGLAVWDVEIGERSHTLLGHPGAIAGVTFTPDGSKIISAAHDGTVRIWDLETGDKEATFKNLDPFSFVVTDGYLWADDNKKSRPLPNQNPLTNDRQDIGDVKNFQVLSCRQPTSLPRLADGSTVWRARRQPSENNTISNYLPQS